MGLVLGGLIGGGRLAHVTDAPPSDAVVAEAVVADPVLPDPTPVDPVVVDSTTTTEVPATTDTVAPDPVDAVVPMAAAAILPEAVVVPSPDVLYPDAPAWVFQYDEFSIGAAVRSENGDRPLPCEVIFSEGGEVLADVLAGADAFAGFTTSFDTVGTHTVTVATSATGDTGCLGDAVASIDIVVVSRTPVVTVVPDPASVVVGTGGVLTIEVAPPAALDGIPVPSGQVEVSIDGVVIGSPTLVDALDSGDPVGQTTLSFPSSLTVGTHVVTVTYPGDDTWNEAAGEASIVVTPRATTTTSTTTTTTTTTIAATTTTVAPQVLAAGVVASTTTTAAATTTTAVVSAAGALPVTGGDPSPILRIATATLAAGLLALLLARLRRPRSA